MDQKINHKEVRKILNWIKIKRHNTLKFEGCIEAVLRGKPLTLNFYIRKDEIFQISKPMLPFEITIKWRKGETQSQKKEIIMRKK